MTEVHGAAQAESRITVAVPGHVLVSDVEGISLAVDVVAMKRHLLDSDVARVLSAVRANPTSVDALTARARAEGWEVDVPAVVDGLCREGLLHRGATPTSSLAALIRQNETSRPAGATSGYASAEVLRVDDLAPLPASARRDILLIGGCVMQFARGAVRTAFRRRGLDARISHHWPSVRGRLPALCQEFGKDLVVLAPTVQNFLTGLFDEGVFLTPAEREKRLMIATRALSATIAELADAVGGGVGLVHNVAPPALSPFGRHEFAYESNLRHVVNRLNESIDEAVRRRPNLMVLDEERLVRYWGAKALFDDHVFPFGHHGGDPDCSIEVPNQHPLLSQVLGEEYAACYESTLPDRRIKCVAVDLDNTLWPGIAADDGFGWLDADRTSTWMHLGLHQALRILKERGILLVSVSKGDPEATLSSWRGVHRRDVLRVDDFVMHCISWDPKSSSIERACRTIGLDPAQVVFLDDNPVERAEVRRHVPAVTVADVPVEAMREWLLTLPGVDVRTVSAEARSRIDTTRAAIAVGALRDEALSEGRDLQDFIADQSVVVTVREAGPNDLDRAAELYNRTNQFTTTGLRVTPGEIRDHARRGRVFLASVRDRFADYGTVGALTVLDGEVTALAVSCRVIGLDVGPVFLLAASTRLPAGTTVHGSVVPTGRNTAAQDVYERAGFRSHDMQRWELSAEEAVERLDEWPQRLVYNEEGQGSRQ